VASIASAIVSGVVLALLLMRVLVAGQFHLTELLGSLAFLQAVGVSLWVWHVAELELEFERRPVRR
jgi:hypothetical protein